MKVAALLSGGKDSVAAIQVVQDWGWQVACVVTMQPAEDDAWMFHTPNIDVTEAVAQCLGLPRIAAPCRADPEEEVEDLQAALAKAQEEHGLDGVVSGALASEYQRTRIDRIGHALALKTFAPLWHVEPTQYMRSLVDGGYDVRIARAAADGLDASWAGRRLDHEAIDELQTKRLHVAGEGGEFETLVLDAPHYGKRVVVEEADVEESASRATWVVRRWKLAG